MRRAGGLAAAVLALGATLAAAQAAPEPVAVESRTIEGFRRSDPEQRFFGALEWVGGFEIVSRDGRFSALSSLTAIDDGTHFLAVADTGYLFETMVARDAEGRPIGWTDTRLSRLLDADGEPYRSKSAADAEALDYALAPDGSPEVLVAFEGDHRIEAMAFSEADMQGLPTALPIPDAITHLGGNRGLEAIAVAPAGTPLAGHIVAIGERDRDGDADIPGWILGVDGGAFRLRRVGNYDVTDAAFLPNGDLLVLERAFSITDLLAMRIRLIAAADLMPSRTADAAVLLEADLAYEIDNMEGIASWTRPDGGIAIAVLSDDNESFLQRTIYLEFRLDPDRLAPHPPPRPQL